MTLPDPDTPAKVHDSHSRRDLRYWLRKAKLAKLERRDAARHADDDLRHYAAMSKVVVAAIPDHEPGVPLGQVLEAARRNTTRRMFPGDTHRMWAVKVLNDLRATGAVRQDHASHLVRGPARSAA
jgi:hypothetical protein